MTNQNNAAQAAQDLAHEIWAAAQTPPDDTIDAAVARIVAVLSRLRAPVAHQDERAAFDHWFDTAQGNAGPWSAWQARAALASAPVPNQDKAIDEALKERDDREEIIDKLLDRVLGADRAEWSSAYDYSDALIEVEDYMHGLRVKLQDIAPVAGEETDDCAIVGRITVKGKGRSSVDLDASHADLPIGEYLIFATSESAPKQRMGWTNDQMIRFASMVLFKGVSADSIEQLLTKFRELEAVRGHTAPQASEAGVRNAALEALQAAQQFIRNGVELGYIRMPDADVPDPAHRTPGLIDAAIRALKQPQADKDGAEPHLPDGSYFPDVSPEGPWFDSDDVRAAVLADRQQRARDTVGAAPAERAEFETWAEGAGLIVKSHGLMSINHKCDAAWEAWKARAVLASAPVAGEAQQPVAVVRDNPEDYGTVIDALVALPVGTQLFAAPQPSSVAGEAQLLAVAWRINAAEARAYGKVATAATLEECARELESLDAAPSARADAEITSYALVGGTRVERVAQPDGTYLWAVRRNGRCLGLDGHWSYEPLPSSRTTQWLALHRFPTAQAAIAAQEGHNKGQDHG